MSKLHSWALIVASYALPAIAAAQDETNGRATTFRAGAQHEDLPGGWLLIGGYGAVFVMLLGYVISLGLRQARVSRDLEALRRDVQKRDVK